MLWRTALGALRLGGLCLRALPLHAVASPLDGVGHRPVAACYPSVELGDLSPVSAHLRLVLLIGRRARVTERNT
jgi:hypothetical protein